MQPNPRSSLSVMEPAIRSPREHPYSRYQSHFMQSHPRDLFRILWSRSIPSVACLCSIHGESLTPSISWVTWEFLGEFPRCSNHATSRVQGMLRCATALPSIYLDLSAWPQVQDFVEVASLPLSNATSLSPQTAAHPRHMEPWSNCDHVHTFKVTVVFIRCVEAMMFERFMRPLPSAANDQRNRHRLCPSSGMYFHEERVTARFDAPSAFMTPSNKSSLL